MAKPEFSSYVMNLELKNQKLNARLVSRGGRNTQQMGQDVRNTLKKHFKLSEAGQKGWVGDPDHPGRKIRVQGPQYKTAAGPTKNITTIDTTEIYQKVKAAALVAVSQTSGKAYSIALNKVPVRHVFKGGRRAAPRELTHEELDRDARQLLQFKAQGRLGSRQEAAVQANISERQGTRVRPRNSDRANTHQGSFYLRGVDFDRALLLTDSAYSRLHSRGRYELGTAESPGRGVHFKGLQTEEGTIHASTGTLGGALRDSIHQQNRSEGDIVKTAIIAGNQEAYYAEYVEFGTHHAAAQPFLRPALKAAEQTFPSVMREKLGALEKANAITD